jgi:MOSC N-terminal beta barrel domain
LGSAQTAGSVVALERYPVKSMMGEALNAVEVSEVGLGNCDQTDVGRRLRCLCERLSGVRRGSR